MKELLASIARAYDPDYVAVHVPILEDLAHDDPEFMDRILAEHSRGQEDLDGVWQELRTMSVNIEGLDALAEQATSYLSPFKGFAPGTRKFSPSDVVWLHRYGDSQKDLNVVKPAPHQQIFVLDLSRVDPAIALMVESRIGKFDPADREGRNIIELPVMEEDLPGIVNLAIAGTVRPAMWDLHKRYVTASGVTPSSGPELTLDQFLANTPFSSAGQSTIKIRMAFPEAPVVCVIGETADDHALALLCDRLFEHGAWVPTHLIRDSGPLQAAVKMALYSLRNSHASSDRPIIFTSASEPAAVIEPLAAELNDLLQIYGADGAAISDPRKSQYVNYSALAAEHGRSMLADPESFSLRRYLPVAQNVGDISVLAPFDVPSPVAVKQLGTSLNWCIDVFLPRHQTPARTSLTSDRLQHAIGAFPEANVRSSRDGLTFASANFGFVYTGTPVEARLALPLLRFPSADEIFSDLAAGADAQVQRSSAGRRSSIAAEMWGSFKALSDDLVGPIRELLNAFMPPKGARGDYAIGYEIRGTGYIAIEDAAKVLKVELQDARSVLDRLVDLKVLRQGFLLYCARCRTYDFYRIDQVGATFDCLACGHVSPLTRGQWYAQDPEPHWYYALDQVVHDLLTHHGDVPILAAAKMGHGASSLLWSPELELTDAVGSIEIDICVVINGRIIIGEAKSNASLRGDKSTEEVAKGLARAAQVLSADEIVLATSRERWATGVVQAVKDAVAANWTMGPRPLISELTRVGQAT
jgi:hypothetical protein